MALSYHALLDRLRTAAASVSGLRASPRLPDQSGDGHAQAHGAVRVELGESLPLPQQRQRAADPLTVITPVTLSFLWRTPNGSYDSLMAGLDKRDALVAAVRAVSSDDLRCRIESLSAPEIAGEFADLSVEFTCHHQINID